MDDDARVKHLNPRQGITISPSNATFTKSDRSLCETPKSPPGDYNRNSNANDAANVQPMCETPKSPPGDYNKPRQMLMVAIVVPCVKHLNPRQGITTGLQFAHPRCGRMCETPTSPPGDDNPRKKLSSNTLTTIMCETPKSPPGDYNVCMK